MSDYKRLTNKITIGNQEGSILECVHCPKVENCKNEVNYRNTCLRVAIDRLAELEDKIDNGTLIELPCKVGDTFYGIQGDDCFAYCCYGFKYGLRRGEDDDSRVLYILTIYEMEFVWGEEAFLTEAEAEAKLEQIRKENNNER